MKKQSSVAKASKNDEVNKLIQRQEKELNKARRQLEIEAALERVRSLTMVMKHSGELSEIILTVYKELRQLDMALTRTLIWLFSENPDMFEVWVADTEAEKTSFVMKQEVEHPYHKRMFEKWKERKSKWVYINEGEGKKDLDDYLFTKTAAVAVPEEVKAGIRGVDRIVNTFSFHNFGAIQADGAEELPDEKFEILHRFAKEFDLAYTRFLDLQKAEEQMLEAQIEAGLERVRAQAMAMHRTDDLVLTIEMFYEQMSILLDTPIVQCGAGLLNKKNSICELASASKNDNGKTFSAKGNIDMNGHPLLKNTYNHWLEQKEYYHVLSGFEIKKYYQYMTNQVAIHDFTDDEEQHFYFPMFSEGSFYVITNRELLEDELRVFRRFSSVLSLTYRRFNDLKRAEKQAREAEIEVALERIRSSSLAMQKSDELQKIVTVVIKELMELGVALDAGGGVIICTYIEDSKDFHQWMASPDFSHSGSYLLPYFDHPIMNDSWNFKESGVDFSSKSYSEEEKNSFFKHSFEHSDHKYFHDDLKKWILQTKKYVLSWAWSKNSAILIPSHTGMVPSESEKEILIRFSRVFDQAYTRFLDLQKAEAQAREAQIEAALERVRSRTMGMQRSEELKDAAMLLFQQVEALGVPVFGCGFNIWDENHKEATAWMAGKDRLQPPFKTSSSEDIFLRIYEAEERGESLFVEEQGGEALKIHYEYMKSIPVFKEIADKMATAGQTFPAFQIMHCAFFSHGYLMFISFEPVQSSWDIFKRFAKVFEQTYTRFLDLQKAELQAREAVRQASLDRLRGEIASMRTSGDLDRITPLIWKELTHLNIPFIRCGVFIMDGDRQVIHNYLSTPDGEAIAAFDLPYDTPGFVTNVLQHWQDKKIYIDYWDTVAMTEFAKVLVQQNIYTSPDQYLKALPKEGFFLHLLPFLQGMLYVGNLTQLGDDRMDVLQSVANTFSTAYSRYDDFNKLELAKDQVDKALVELKQAQQQLIQSEKMASLGELTAGIAHEIQNPLNFVNNFSEVNKELLEELRAERSKLKVDRDEKLEDEIISDVTENQVKINEHGKRASEIVKSMLQHSRSSAGEKEPTDVNALCDEYMRLAYHGMRAKNKSFNAEYKLELDPGLPKINIVPQDIGRVLLNLINNAFQALSSKALASEDHSVTGVDNPRVTLITQQLNNSITIRIVDNGLGIPDEIRDKIFQPFFTTKPAGQGTGLGLSLSYDIIKAHGGEIKINSNPGLGSEFIIHLPIY